MNRHSFCRVLGESSFQKISTPEKNVLVYESTIISNYYVLSLHSTLKNFCRFTSNFDENEIIWISNTKWKNLFQIKVKMQKLQNGGVNLLKAQRQISKKRFIEMSSKSQVNNRSGPLEVFCNETVQQILAKFTRDIFLKTSFRVWEKFICMRLQHRCFYLWILCSFSGSLFNTTHVNGCFWNKLRWNK